MGSGIQGERWDPGRAAGWRGRCTEVGERAFLGVKFAEGLFILILCLQLLLSPDLQLTSRFLLPQHSKSLCPCSHAHPVPLFPRTQGLLRLIASAFFLQMPSLSLRAHSPVIYFPVSARPHLLPCDYVLYDFPECHNLALCPRSLRIPWVRSSLPLPLRLCPLGRSPLVRLSLHLLPRLLQISGAHTWFQSSCLRAYPPTFLLTS